jgi:hypothetical protein
MHGEESDRNSSWNEELEGHIYKEEKNQRK